MLSSMAAPRLYVVTAAAAAQAPASEPPYGPLRAGSVGPKTATPGFARAAARCSGPLSTPNTAVALPGGMDQAGQGRVVRLLPVRFARMGRRAVRSAPAGGRGRPVAALPKRDNAPGATVWTPIRPAARPARSRRTAVRLPDGPGGSGKTGVPAAVCTGGRGQLADCDPPRGPMSWRFDAGRRVRRRVREPGWRQNRRCIRDGRRTATSADLSSP